PRRCRKEERNGTQEAQEAQGETEHAVLLLFRSLRMLCPSDNDHQAACPRQLYIFKVTATLQIVDEQRNLRGVILWPVRLGKKIVDAIDAADSEQGKGGIKMSELTGPRVREYEIPRVARFGQECSTVRQM